METADFDKRIKQEPYSTSWYNSTCGFKDSFREEGIIDYEGLSDEDKIRLYVYAWNRAGILPRKKGILKTFSLTDSMFRALYKSAGDIKTTPAFTETGLFAGKGYEYCPTPANDDKNL